MMRNPGFEEGLFGWKVEGAVEVNIASPLAGKASARLGPGVGALRQRYDVPGLRIIYVGATIKPSAPTVSALLRLQCFDRKNHIVLDLTAKPDAKNNAGIYTKTHAFTSYAIVSIEKTAAGGFVDADNVLLNDDDRDRVEHKPQGSVSEWMKPFWEGHKTVDESVLLLSRNGGPPTGKLLFPATRVLKVCDPAKGLTFMEGKDFVVNGEELQALPGSKITTMKDSEFAKGQFPWTDLAGRHVFVTYEHALELAGPIPDRTPKMLPGTLRRLHKKKPLTIVAFGDSITVGMNGSGFRNVPPYQPPWATLFADELGRIYGDSKIRLYNTALGGATSDWGKELAPQTVATLNPDLVLIAFGMNDFWSNAPSAFRENIREIIRAVRARRPSAEFILIASIKFNPDYTNDPTYEGNLQNYLTELRKFEGPGVAILDMTTISDMLYTAKSAADVQTDPMHPDDYLARWYAQGLVELLGGER